MALPSSADVVAGVALPSSADVVAGMALPSSADVVAAEPARARRTEAAG